MPKQQDTPKASKDPEQAATIFTKLPMLGRINWLLTQSISHRHFFINDLEWLVMPPLLLDQCKLYMNNEAPVAYVSWALMSDVAGDRYIENGAERIAPKDWKSGENVWLIDVVAPFGGIKEIVEDLRQKIFPGKTVRMITTDPKTNKKQVITVGENLDSIQASNQTKH